MINRVEHTTEPIEIDLQDLMVKAKSEDEHIARPAFEELFQRYAVLVWRHALGIVKRTEIADEIRQQTFLKAWEKRDTIKTNVNFKAWLYSITEHLAVDFLRRHFNSRSQSLDAVGSNKGFEIVDATSGETEDILSNKDLVGKALQRMLKRVPERSLQILRSHYLDDETYPEIALRLDTTEEAISALVHRSVVILRNIVDSLLHKQDVNQPTDSVEVKINAERGRLEEALNQITNPTAAAALRLQLIDGLPTRAIAAHLGKGDNATAQLLSHHRKYLAELLGGEIPNLHSTTPRLDAILAEHSVAVLGHAIDQIGKATTREELRQHLVEGLSSSEIASQTGQVYNSVQVRLTRGKDELEQILAKPKTPAYSDIAV